MTTAPPLVVLALDYHRDPLAHRSLSEVERPLPRDFEHLFSEFCAALSATRIHDTAAALGITPEELAEAARFLVRHALLDARGDYYRHLGLNRDASLEAIRQHYLLLIRMFHPDRLDDLAETEGFYATRINLAYQTLSSAA